MRRIILASTSPRRKELMAFLGIPYEVVNSGFPEEDVDTRDFEDPREYVATLAAGKALMASQEYDDAIVVGVDTTVFANGKYYGKPNSLDDARKTLHELKGKTHQVFTAICMIDTLTHERLVEVVESGVTFFPLPDEIIDSYVQTSESLGKAGAYAIQAGAKKFVNSVNGSLSSVVGLPLTEIAQMFERFGITIDVDVRRIEEEQFSHNSE